MTHPKHVAHDAQAAFEAFKAAGHDPVAECPMCHEMWQYMGTYQPEGGEAFHQFRHRCDPALRCTQKCGSLDCHCSWGWACARLSCGGRRMLNLPTDRIYPRGWSHVDGGVVS